MRTISKNSDIPTFKLFRGQEEWPSTEILHHEHVQHRMEGHKGNIRTHRHLDLFHILYVSRGLARLAIDGETIIAEAPTIATVPPLCVHGLATDPEVRGHLLTIPGSSMQYIMSHADNDAEILDKPLVVQGNPAEEFSTEDRLLDQIAIEYQENQSSRFMAIQSLTRLLLVSMIRRIASNENETTTVLNRDAQRIRKFKKMIERNFSNGTSIQDYARELGISSAQLNNICRANVGKSALQIVHERTALEARRQLLYTAQNISEIAYNLGFNDPAYFTRFFTKQIGISPKKFRQSQPAHGQL